MEKDKFEVDGVWYVISTFKPGKKDRPCIRYVNPDGSEGEKVKEGDEKAILRDALGEVLKHPHGKQKSTYAYIRALKKKLNKK